MNFTKHGNITAGICKDKITAGFFVEKAGSVNRRTEIKKQSGKTGKPRQKHCNLQVNMLNKKAELDKSYR